MQDPGYRQTVQLFKIRITVFLQVYLVVLRGGQNNIANISGGVHKILIIDKVAIMLQFVHLKPLA